ncbi:hypothetical protein, partial [Sphingobacterium hotanense]
MKYIFHVLLILTLFFAGTVQAQEADSLISLDDVEFSSGADTQVLDTSLTEDVVFTDGQDSVAQDTTAASTVVAT